MEKTKISECHNSSAKEEEGSLADYGFDELLQTLPKETSMAGFSLSFYQGCWFRTDTLKPIFSFQKHFQALDNDVFIISFPKSGTHWLSALIFFIVNRTTYPSLQHNPLLRLGVHDVVPLIELSLRFRNSRPDLKNIPQPRVFSTHIPYASLPPSVKDSNCKIVYICRNPMDVLVSYWHFMQKIRNAEPLPLELAFNQFSQGIFISGPYWDHLSGFYKASQENPGKVLFLTYEDLKDNNVSNIKKVAEFLGYPFSEEEEKQGVAQEIGRLCSLESMKGLEVHKNGEQPLGIPNSAFFRKGEVGDWSNYLTTSMAERLEKIVQEKLAEKQSGLKFSLSTGRIQIPKA